MIDIDYMLEKGILRPNSEQYNKFIDIAEKLKYKVVHILNCIAKVYGYEYCYVTKNANEWNSSCVKFSGRDNNGIIHIANARIDGLNIYAKCFADVFASLMYALLKGKKISADSPATNESKVFSNKEVLSMLRFELALEGIDVAELFDKKFNA